MIRVDKVINLDIFLTKTHRFALLTPWSSMDYFYNGWMHFFGLNSSYSLPL